MPKVIVQRLPEGDPQGYTHQIRFSDKDYTQAITGRRLLQALEGNMAEIDLVVFSIKSDTDDFERRLYKS